MRCCESTWFLPFSGCCLSEASGAIVKKFVDSSYARQLRVSSLVPGTWMRRYLTNIQLRHLPTICIVSLETLAKCIAIAAPDLIEWVPMQSVWSPSRSSPASVVVVLSCLSITLEEMSCSSSESVIAIELIGRFFCPWQLSRCQVSKCPNGAEVRLIPAVVMVLGYCCSFVPFF